MTVTHPGGDPAEWSEEEIVGRALFELFQEFPQYARQICFLDIVGETEFSGSIIIEAHNEEAARLFRIGTPLNRRLSQLIEKPVEVILSE